MGSLIIYRFGSYVSLPGINPAIITSNIMGNKGSFMSVFNLFAGGAISRGSFFTLSVFPYISASLAMQFASSSAGFDFLIKLKAQGEEGQNKINAYTKYLSIILGFVFGLKYCHSISQMHLNGNPAIYISKALFMPVALIHMLAGMMFLIWLGNRISKKGISNGISLIIFSGIIGGAPSALLGLFQYLKNLGSITPVFIFLSFLAFLIGLVIIMDQSYRKLNVQYPSLNKFGTKSLSISHELPLKINNASIIPSMMAGTVISFPGMIYSSLVKLKLDYPFIKTIFHLLSHGEWLYYVLWAILIVFFTMVYTPIAFDSKSIGDNLKKNDALVENYRPGIQTSLRIEKIVANLSIYSSIYLVIICIPLDIIIMKNNLPFYFTGTSCMISVSSAIEIYQSFKSYIINIEYEKILKNEGFKKLLNK